MSSFSSIVKTLHEQSEHQLIERARKQFKGNNEEFSQILQAYLKLAPREKGKFLEQHGLSSQDDASSTANRLSLAISEDMGLFLRNITLTLRPNVILELASSCGVSTMYFANALKKIGKGKVIATEFDPWKVEQLRANLIAAGLEEWVDIREGDVMETLSTIHDQVDIAFIDIWATGYLTAFKSLRPLLRQGSVVLTDNMFTAESEVQDFKTHLEQDGNLSTTTLNFESGVEFTVIV